MTILSERHGWRRPGPPRWPTLLAGLILLAGAALRVRAFAAPLSLWGDELAAAIYLLGLPHDPIIEGWVAHQPAPLGFRALTRLAVGALGVSEASLRLVPLLASLASLPLFRWLATRWAGARRALLPVLVFAVNPFLVRYAAEFKPYSLDVLVACTLMLFYCPMLALGLGEGTWRATEASSRPWIRAGVAVALAALLAGPVSSSLSGFLRPRSISDARPVLEFVAAQRQADDVLYAFPYALPAITYYGPRLGLDDVPVVTALRQGGAPDPLAHTFEKIRPGARVWFIMTRVPEFDFTENEREILTALDARGRRLGTFRATGATAYLYQLREPTRPAAGCPGQAHDPAMAFVSRAGAGAG